MLALIGKYVINLDYLAYAIDDAELDSVVLTMAKENPQGELQLVLSGQDRTLFFKIVSQVLDKCQVE